MEIFIPVELTGVTRLIHIMFLKTHFIFIYMCIYISLCVGICTMHVECLRRPAEAVGSPGTRVTGVCEPLEVGNWEQN